MTVTFAGPLLQRVSTQAVSSLVQADDTDVLSGSVDTPLHRPSRCPAGSPASHLDVDGPRVATSQTLQTFLFQFTVVR